MQTKVVLIALISVVGIAYTFSDDRLTSIWDKFNTQYNASIMRDVILTGTITNPDGQPLRVTCTYDTVSPSGMSAKIVSKTQEFDGKYEIVHHGLPSLTCTFYAAHYYSRVISLSDKELLPLGNASVLQRNVVLDPEDVPVELVKQELFLGYFEPSSIDWLMASSVSGTTTVKIMEETTSSLQGLNEIPLDNVSTRTALLYLNWNSSTTSAPSLVIASTNFEDGIQAIVDVPTDDEFYKFPKASQIAPADGYLKSVDLSGIDFTRMHRRYYFIRMCGCFGKISLKSASPVGTKFGGISGVLCFQDDGTTNLTTLLDR